MKKILLVLLLLNIYSLHVLAQELTITGTVRDEQRKAVVGGTLIAIPSGKRLGLTRENGSFSVKIPGGTTSMRLSHLNYEDVVVQLIAGKTSYEVHMKERT